MDEQIDDLLSQGRDEEVRARIDSMLQQPAQTPMPPEVAAGVLEAIVTADEADNTPVVEIQRTRKWWLVAACAAFVLLALGAGYCWLYTPNGSHQEHTQQKLANKPVNDVLPGGNKAVLTLADGSRIVLDSTAAGALTLQGNTKIMMQHKGTLAYHSGKQKTGTPVLYNTVSTPNGGQYQIILPDGTHVWLNAASSIRFPTAFASERKITMTGEAYFEVAHNAHRPFIVNVNNKEEVTVLGTHFNINAYDNEKAIHTTLLQGSVKVGKGQTAKGSEQSVTLKPGEQAIALTSPLTTHHSTLTIDHSPDIDKVMSWKNGLFNLTGADFTDFMRQVERWYDVTVHYESAVPGMEFQGKLNRAVPLSDIVEYLKNLGVACRLEGKTLFVKAK
jgi:ferric-dicitrate binding protein FerR (iron transport regulator)